MFTKRLPTALVCFLMACGGSSAQRDVAKPSTVDRGGLAWFEDDADAAFALARRLDRPVLLDYWAPWCGPCLTMRAFVLNAANLGKDAEGYVLLAIDTENPKNTAFLGRYPVAGLPSFRVLDPRDGAELARLEGLVAAETFRAFLGEGVRAIALSRAGGLAADDPLAVVTRARADRDHQKIDEAIAGFRAALSRAPAGWPFRTHTVADLGFTLMLAGRGSECVDELVPVAGNVSAAERMMPLGLASACAMQLPETDPRRASTFQAVARGLEAVCSGKEGDVPGAARAMACRAQAEALGALGDGDGGRRAAQHALGHIEAATRGLPIELAASLDGEHAWALQRLGRTDEAVALLVAHERALPRDYNPPSNLATLYQEQKSWDLALAAVDRALALCQGPYRAAFLEQKVDLLSGAGRKDEARAVLDEQLVFLRGLPESGMRNMSLGRAEQRRAEWK